MTRASGTTEVFSRAVIDAQLQDVGWNPKDGQSVRYEYPLPDSTRADYVLCDSRGRAMAEGIISRDRAEELSPGIVSIDLSAGQAGGKDDSRDGGGRIASGTAIEEKMSKAKKIAALPLDERRKLLEAAAKRAAHEYETDKELTVFTELDGTVNGSPWRNMANQSRPDHRA